MVTNLDGFDPLRDVISTSGSTGIPLTKLASYRSVIWSSYSDVTKTSDFPLLYTFIKYRPKSSTTTTTTSSTKSTPNLIALAMAAGTHFLITGAQPVQNAVNRVYAAGVRYPIIFRYELTGSQTDSPDVTASVGDQSFAYKELCLETLDFAYTTVQRRRQGSSLYCTVNKVRKADANSLRDDTVREAIPIDPAFPRLTLRPEATDPGRFYNPSSRGIDAEVYNPMYFVNLCPFVPRSTRACFQPIYGAGMNDTAEPTYGAPIAFWTSTFADRVPDAPGAVGARSAVFGFPPVFFKPDEVRPAIEHILFDEWQLPRRATAVTSSR